MNKLLVILGPTATGKTDLALKLAKKFNGELVSCDSRQVYIGLDIGTGKFPSGKWKMEGGEWKKGKGFWEIDGIKIHMYDVVSLKRQYSVFNYVKDVSKVINDISKRGKLPIVVGGTGLYLRALLEGLDSLTIPSDRKLRESLAKLSLGQLQKKLQEVSLSKWELMNQSDRQNPRRLIRVIELTIFAHEGDPSSLITPQDDHARGGSNVLKVGLAAPREVLYKNVDERVVSRMKQGMIEETKRLHEDGLTYRRMKKLGLEYGVIADYLAEVIKTKEALIKLLQNKIHGYVRRQLTWFKKEKDVRWFDITNPDTQDKIEKVVGKWYDQQNAAKN